MIELATLLLLDLTGWIFETVLNCELKLGIITRSVFEPCCAQDHRPKTTSRDPGSIQRRVPTTFSPANSAASVCMMGPRNAGHLWISSTR